MKFTEHAKMRMVERNFTASMIEDAMEPLMKQGAFPGLIGENKKLLY